MALKAYPLNLTDYEYNAKDVMFFHYGRCSGVFGDDELEVTADSTSMYLSLTPGRGWITNGTSYGIPFWAEDTQTFPVCVADGSLPVIALAVVSWETEDEEHLPVLKIIQSSPALSPTTPEISKEGEYAQIALAKIYIPAGTTAITSDMITDLRLDEDYCGIVSDGIVKYPTQGYADQFNAWYENIKNIISNADAAAIELEITQTNSDLEAVSLDFQVGCETVADSITENGVPTAYNDSPTTMANNINLIRLDNKTGSVDTTGLLALDWTEDDISNVYVFWDYQDNDYYKVNPDLITLWSEIKDLSDDEIYSQLIANYEILNWYPKFDKFSNTYPSSSETSYIVPSRYVLGIPYFSSDLEAWSSTFFGGWFTGLNLGTFYASMNSATNVSSCWKNNCNLYKFEADLQSVTSLANTWENCCNLREFKADLRNVTSVSSAWLNCNEIDVFDADLRSLTSFDDMSDTITNVRELKGNYDSITSISGLWRYNGILQKLDASFASLGTEGTTSNAYNTLYAFSEAKALKEVNISLPNLPYDSGMFKTSYALTTFSGDMSSCTYFEYTWFSCQNLVDFYCDMSSAETLRYTWSECADLKTFTDSNADLSNATTFYYTWGKCSQLKEFSADLSSGTSFQYAWYRNTVLESFDADLSNGINFKNAWADCSNLTSFDFDLSNGTDFEDAWTGCSGLTSFTADVSSGTTFEGAWQGCTGLTSFNSDLSNGLNFKTTWWRCTSLTEFNPDLSSGTDFSYAWSYCSGLTSFTADVSNGTNFSYAWQYCTALTSFGLDLSTNTASFNEAWKSCTSLTTFTANLNSGTTFYAAWSGCTNLTTFTASINNSTNYGYAWNNCTSLTSLIVENTAGSRMDGVCENCSSLHTVKINLGFVSTAVYGEDCFNGCSSLVNAEVSNIKYSLSFSDSPLLSVDSLVYIINNLQTVTSTQTLTLGSTNLAKLTTAQKAVATNKGWTLA